jgi:glycosyltransferase involved in cell wall biosynthesis
VRRWNENNWIRVRFSDKRSLPASDEATLKLLHVTHQYRPALGGAEEYVAMISEALVARGHEVYVYTANSTDYESWTGDLPAREIINGVEVHRFRAIPRGKLTWKLLHYGLWNYLERPKRRYEPFILVGNGPTCPGMAAAIAASGRHYDLVHLSCLHYAHTAYGYAAARLTGRPVVVTPHLHVEQRVTWDVSYMRGILKRADLTFAQTEYERQFHIALGRDPNWVTTGGVGIRPEEYRFEDQATSRRKLGVPEGAQVILFLGRQIDYKGPDRVLAAAQAIAVDYPRLQVLLVGPESEWSRGMVARYAGAPWLHNLGRVEPDVKLAALMAADLMVMPSHGEAFGVTYLESWMARRPVIGLRKGAVATLIAHDQDGILVPPDDDAALIEAIRRLLSAPEQAAAMGQAGYLKVMARYTLDRLTDVIESAYLRLLEAKEAMYAC